MSLKFNATHDRLGSIITIGLSGKGIEPSIDCAGSLSLAGACRAVGGFVSSSISLATKSMFMEGSIFTIGLNINTSCL